MKVKVMTSTDSSTRDRMYIWVKDETMVQNFANRFHRPYDVYKKEVLPKVMEHLKKYDPTTYNLLKGVKWGWKQSCGCTCGCSPGFVGSTSNKLNIHVEI